MWFFGTPGHSSAGASWFWRCQLFFLKFRAQLFTALWQNTWAIKSWVDGWFWYDSQTFRRPNKWGPSAVTFVQRDHRGRDYFLNKLNKLMTGNPTRVRFDVPETKGHPKLWRYTGCRNQLVSPSKCLWLLSFGTTGVSCWHGYQRREVPRLCATQTQENAVQEMSAVVINRCPPRQPSNATPPGRSRTSTHFRAN